jgi:YD repeat-containing protein
MKRALCLIAFFMASCSLQASQTLTRNSAFEYDPTTGLLIREIVEPGDSNFCLVTAYTYDVYGNRTSATTRNCNGTSSGGVTEAPAPSGAVVFQTRTSSTRYDEPYSVEVDGTTYMYPLGLFPTTRTNALNHSEIRLFDPRFGGVLRLLGPNNLHTDWTYDKFGRVTSETRADGSASNTTYSLCGTCPANGAYFVSTTNDMQPTVTTYYDKLSRELRVDKTGFDAVWPFASAITRRDTEYDSLGRVNRASLPYWTGDAPVWTSFTYDILGRVLTQSDPTGATTTKSYNALITTTTNALGQVETQARNSQGQITQITRQ